MFACARHDTGPGSSRPGATSHTVPAQSLRVRPPHAALRLRESWQLPLFAGAAPATASLPSPLRTMPLAPLSLLEISCRRRDMRNGRVGQGTAHCSSTISCRERNSGTRGDEVSTRGLLDVGGLESQSSTSQQMARARRARRQAHYLHDPLCVQRGAWVRERPRAESRCAPANRRPQTPLDAASTEDRSAQGTKARSVDGPRTRMPHLVGTGTQPRCRAAWVVLGRLWMRLVSPVCGAVCGSHQFRSVGVPMRGQIRYACLETATGVSGDGRRVWLRWCRALGGGRRRAKALRMRMRE